MPRAAAPAEAHARVLRISPTKALGHRGGRTTPPLTLTPTTPNAATSGGGAAAPAEAHARVLRIFAS